MPRPLVHFTAESFPTTPLALQTNDPAEQESRRGFSETMQEIANHFYPAAKALIDRARARRATVGEEQTRKELREVVDALRISIASTRALIATNPLPFTSTTYGNGENYDQWGDAPKFRDREGNPTPASEMSIGIGNLIESRFDSEAPDTDKLVNFYEVPDRSGPNRPAKTIEGNSLLRRSEADAAAAVLTERLLAAGIPDPQFGQPGKRTFTVSAPEEALPQLYEAAQEASVDLIDAERDPSNPEDLAVYGNTSALLSVSFLHKRGSDASNRIEEAILFACAFGIAPVIDEQDDAQKYVRGQQGTIKWIVDNQKTVPPSEETGRYVSPVEAREILRVLPEQPYWRSFVVLRAEDGRELISEPDEESLESFTEVAQRLKTEEFPAASAFLRAESELLRVEGRFTSSPDGQPCIDLAYFARYGDQYEPIPSDSPFLNQSSNPLAPGIPAYRTQLTGPRMSGDRFWPDKFKDFFERDVAPPPWDVFAAVGDIGEEPRATIRLTPDALAGEPRQGDWHGLQQKLGVKEGENFYVIARSSEDTELVVRVVVDHERLGTGTVAQLRKRGGQEATPWAVLSPEDTEQLLEKPHLVGATAANQFAPDYVSAEYQLRSQQAQRRKPREAPDRTSSAAPASSPAQTPARPPHAIANTGTQAAPSHLKKQKRGP